MQLIAKFIVFFTPCFLASTLVLASAQEPASLEQNRQTFLAAEKALKSGQVNKFNQLSATLKDYPLYPYLVYQELRKNLKQKHPDDIRAFLNSYSQTPLTNRLLSAWLNHLAKTKKWQQFIDFYQDGFGVTRQCQYMSALLNTGQQDKAWPLITDIWLHEKSRPRACDPIFKQWKEAGHQTDALTWHRISLAIDASEIGLARYLAKSLPEKDQADVKQWLELRKNPEITSANAISMNHPYRQLALTNGIEKLARKDLPKALSAWETLKRDEISNPEFIARVEKVLSLQFLKKPTEEEFEYLVFAEPCDQDTKLQEIRIRAALLHNQWPEVLLWLDRLPDKHRNDDRWLYWRARALSMTNQQPLAESILDELATRRSFYGFLAADLRNKSYALNHAELAVEEELLAEIGSQPAIQRAKELLALERYLDARREWYFISATFDEKELLAAAKLAHQWQWHDRAILTLAKAKSWNDLGIRFPVEHKDHVMEQAEKHELDPAWIFAMVRQESAFMQDAQSSVGAMGLMQLMPGTAKSVAKKLKQKRPSKTELFKPEKNIKLGTAYLKQVYERFNENPVLAIAAYNAGPHRVKRWLPQDTMPADIWIELVPFKETRNYLKSVLAFTVIYTDKLGLENKKITDKMPDITGVNTHGPVTAMNR